MQVHAYSEGLLHDNTEMLTELVLWIDALEVGYGFKHSPKS